MLSLFVWVGQLRSEVIGRWAQWLGGCTAICRQQPICVIVHNFLMVQYLHQLLIFRKCDITIRYIWTCSRIKCEWASLAAIWKEVTYDRCLYMTISDGHVYCLEIVEESWGEKESKSGNSKRQAVCIEKTYTKHRQWPPLHAGILRRVINDWQSGKGFQHSGQGGLPDSRMENKKP